jgi:hypothetical protein
MESQDILPINSQDILPINDSDILSLDYYYRLLLPHVTTRSGSTKSLSSCRLWQLLLALLTLYDGRGESIENYLIESYKKIESDKCILYKIISENYFRPQTTIGGIVFGDALNEELKKNADYPIYYMCICEKNGNGFAGRVYPGYGAILHYFTVFYKNDSWYLNSAYADDSNDICIPQYTTPINIGEFKSFVTEINSEKYWEKYKHYFLRDRESANIKAALFDMGNNYKVGLITQYIPLLRSCIGLPSTGGKTKNTIKNKAKRFINRKTKHAIKHKPKRFINRKTKHTIKHRKLKRKYYTIGHLK